MASSPIGTYQHRLPASIIGSFGERAPSGRLRDATVQVTHLASGESFRKKASAIGGENGAYDFAAQTDTADTLWRAVENDLHAALDVLVGARTLAARVQDGRDQLTVADKTLLSQAADIVRAYAVDVEIRSPLFDEIQSRQGLTRDEIQQLRRDLVPRLRQQAMVGDRDLAILTPANPGCPRAIVDDWGYTELERAATGRLMPVRPDLVLFFRSAKTSPTDAAVAWGDLDDYVDEVRKAMTRPPHPQERPRRFVFSHLDDELTDVLPSYQPPRQGT